MHTHCLSCGRPLRSATSQARGRGRYCAAKIRRAAQVADLRDYTTRQLAAAEELIEDAAIIPIRGRRIYRAVSTDGTETYTTARQACTCPAGRADRDCYHRAAVAILTAA
jgi:uncharacterized Zn finger protein